MMKSYLTFNTVPSKPGHEAYGFVSVCRIRSDIEVDS